MKRNAIVRIVLWSIVLVVLLATLFILIYVPGAGHSMRNDPPVETVVPVPLPPVTSPNDGNAIVLSDGLNVRTTPSSMSPVAGMVAKGTQLQITRQELVDGIAWGYSPTPVSGWVVMEYVQLLEPIAEDKTVIDAPAEQKAESQGNGVSLDAANIRHMEIEWTAGNILIQAEDIPQIYIREETTAAEYEPMVWNVRDGKVSIQYSKNTDHAFGMGLHFGEHSKDLIIQVPLDWQCDSLEIDAASASLKAKDLTIREMEFDGASGICVFENCIVDKLDVDTASGDVQFQGALNQMDCDSASANIVLELSNVPKRLDLDTASGDLNVVLPPDAGFTVKMDTMSGDFSSDFETTLRNDSHIAGNGRCIIDVDAMSGSVNIRKGQ